jgi:hypothetical protein
MYFTHSLYFHRTDVREIILNTPEDSGGKMMSDSRRRSPLRHKFFCEESRLRTLRTPLTSSPALSLLSPRPDFKETNCCSSVRHDGSVLVLKAIRC